MKPHILKRLRRSFYDTHDAICRATGRKPLPDDKAPSERDIRQVLTWLQRGRAWAMRSTRGARRLKQQRTKYMHWLRCLKVGDVVGPCYDGKSSRKRRGVVVKRMGKGVVFVSFVQWASDDLEPKVVKFKRGKGWGNWYYSLRRWTAKDSEDMASAAEAVTKELRAVMADMEGVEA